MPNRYQNKDKIWMDDCDLCGGSFKHGNTIDTNIGAREYCFCETCAIEITKVVMKYIETKKKIPSPKYRMWDTVRYLGGKRIVCGYRFNEDENAYFYYLQSNVLGHIDTQVEECYIEGKIV